MSDDVRVDEVDAQDEAALRGWWEVGSAATAERPYDAWPAWEVSRRALPQQRADLTVVLLRATRAGEVVGSGMLRCTELENTHAGEVDVYVAPDLRRQGIGTAVLADAEARTRARGRTILWAAATAAPGGESAGTHFAAAHGFTVASDEETKLVDLAEHAPGWPALQAEVDAARGGYGYHLFQGRCPDEYVDGVCRVLSTFIGEIPTGDLDLEEAAWTPERLRAGEARHAENGTLSLVALALDPDGEVCGFSDLRIHPENSGHASVGGTLVVPGHRGHRLGLGMKLLTHQRVRELFPECAYVETGNAGINAPMNSVNERLGYRVVERWCDLQKRLV